jgi:hypothetical protein
MEGGVRLATDAGRIPGFSRGSSRPILPRQTLCLILMAPSSIHNGSCRSTLPGSERDARFGAQASQYRLARVNQGSLLVQQLERPMSAHRH